MSNTTWPDHLLSLQEWAELPMKQDRHYELVDGVLLVSPRSSRWHQWAIARLAAKLDSQMPDELTAVPEVELVITAGSVATVRVPDILVTRFDLTSDLDAGPRQLYPADSVLVVEILSPGSCSTDRVLKVAEYARAGIGSYWIVDLTAGTITVMESEGETFSTVSESSIVDVTRPVPLHLDLASVLARH